MDLPSKLKSLPSIVELSIKHYKQHYNWDCGVSCVLMVLPEDQRKALSNDLIQICNQEEFNKSTWTIDLCYLLRRFQMDHVFYTLTLGVHPEHRGKHFYENIVSKDEERVNRKFREAKRRGISIVKSSLTITDLLEHISKFGPIIILVDATHLRCETCILSRLSCEIQKMFPWMQYHGHYIVLCGYNTQLGIIYYRNPALRDRICQTSFKAMDKARKSCGTDEDVILINQKTIKYET